MAFSREGYTFKLHGVNTELLYDSDTVCVCGNHVKSLIQNCADQLVCDVYVLSKYKCLPLPQQFMSLLMTTAMMRNRVLSIKLLLDYWQHRDLVVELPDGFNTWKVFFLHRYPDVFETTFQQFLYTSVTGLVKHVLGWIRQNVIKPLNFIDLGECPISDSLVEEIASTVLENARNLKKRKTTLSNHKYTIKMNCTLFKESTARLLMEAMRCLKLEKCHLNLVVTGLHVMPDAVEHNVFDLLYYLDSQQLKILAYERCYANPSDVSFARLCNSIKKFHHIVGLDFSYVGQKLAWFPEAISDLNHRLRKLTHLRRLDISYCRLTNYLERFLRSLYSEENCKDCCLGDNISQRGKLQYLSLASCFLSDYDLIFLSKSAYASTIEYLNLSYNKFATSSIAALLAACTNLKALEMEWCKLTDDSTRTVFQALSSVSTLRFLNIYGLNKQEKLMQDIGLNCENLPQIRCLVVHTELVYFGDQMCVKRSRRNLKYVSRCIFNRHEFHDCTCKIICPC